MHYTYIWNSKDYLVKMGPRKKIFSAYFLSRNTCQNCIVRIICHENGGHNLRLRLHFGNLMKNTHRTLSSILDKHYQHYQSITTTYWISSNYHHQRQTDHTHSRYTHRTVNSDDLAITSSKWLNK